VSPAFLSALAPSFSASFSSSFSSKKRRSVTWRRHDLSEVIEQIPIGVAVTLPLGTVEYANPRLLELLQIDTPRVLGALLRDFRAFASASRDHVIRRRLCSGASWQGETQLRTAGGEVRHVLESVFPLRDRSGRLTHFIHFLP